MKIILPLLICGLSFPINASVQKITPLANEKTSKNKTVAPSSESLSRFTQHEENHLLLDLSGGDFDKHIDAQVSIRYYISEHAFANDAADDSWDYSWFVTYTGKFDFYPGVRDSGPVANRLFNPALFYAHRLNKTNGFIEFRASFEHESNGQDITDTAGLISQANSFYQKNQSDGITRNEAFEIAKEGVSRSSNFLGLGAVYRYNDGKLSSDDCNRKFECVDFHFKLRTFTFGIEEDFFWISDPNQWAELTDYQSTKIQLSTHFGSVNNEKQSSKYGIEISYRTGQIDSNFGDNNTFDLSLYYNWEIIGMVIPLMATYHSGYLSELYQFEKKSSYAMFGFQFIY